MIEVVRKVDDEIVDKVVDIASVLSNPVRRRIRDVLRSHGELTLTEIAKLIGHSEQNTYYHLNEMLKANIVVKRVDKVAGRLVTFYSLSDYYNNLVEVNKIDILPIYALFVVYVVMTLLSLVYPGTFSALFSIFGKDAGKIALASSLVGLITTSIVLLYYLVPELVKYIKYRE